jgi:hypothetical protein
LLLLLLLLLASKVVIIIRSQFRRDLAVTRSALSIAALIL